MKWIGTEQGGLSRGDREHQLQNIVTVAERLLAELFGGGALELRIFTLQPVQRAALHFGFSLVQGAENLQGQRVGVQPRLPVPDQRIVASGHGRPRSRVVNSHKKPGRLIWLNGNSQNRRHA